MRFASVERLEHICFAAAILSIPLLAICVIFIGMWATGFELNISSMVGLKMIVGIVAQFPLVLIVLPTLIRMANIPDATDRCTVSFRRLAESHEVAFRLPS